MHHRIHLVAGTKSDRKQCKTIPFLSDLVEGDFFIAREDLNNDGSKEIILMSNSSVWWGTGGCATVLLEKTGAKYVALLSRNLYAHLAVTNEKIGTYRAPATVDDKGKILLGERKGTPMSGKQMVYGMKP